ncbi:MAG: PepSY domain-containing protein [Thalassotalea sp.]
MNKSIRARIIRHLRKWHRRLGIWAAAFLIFLSITGVALNHTNAFGLAQQTITNSWLLDHYGINSPTNVTAYHQGNIIVTDQFIWLNKQLLVETNDEVVASGKFQQFWLVLTTEKLMLFSDKGEMVDQIDKSLGLPENITHLAVNEHHLSVSTPSGFYQTNSDFIEWQTVTFIVEPNWLAETPLSDNDKISVNNRYRSQFLTLERMIVDAHSGRLFGDFGVYFMDLVAFCLILLSASGIYIWLRYARSKR